MHIVGDEDVDRVYMIEMRGKFYMELCSKLSKKADLLDHLLKIMYTKPKCVPISCQLPTSRVFRFHMLCAHLRGEHLQES